MFFRNYRKFFSLLLFIPVVFLFLFCCCLKAEASSQKKLPCAACPQKNTSNHQTECPHAKIKAISDNPGFVLQYTKIFWAPLLANGSNESLENCGSHLHLIVGFTAPPFHASLCFQNPILRV